tara:strand:- start:642 stop:749 length:108 start_codon:yes stop_codon:yes gene_type:complete
VEPEVTGKGAIEWTLTGALLADTEGSVVYQVQIDN